MTTLAKQSASFAFGPVKQSTSSRHLKNAELTEVINMRKVKDGPYVKRPSLTFDNTSLSSPTQLVPYAPDCLLAAPDGRDLLFRTTEDRAYVWDVNNLTHRDRGKLKRTYPTVTTTIPAKVFHPTPVSVEVGTSTWTFACGEEYVNGRTESYNIRLTVTVTATGEVTYRGNLTGGSGVGSAPPLPRCMAAAYDGTYVWMLYGEYVSGSTTGIVFANRFTPASPSATPTVTTYYTPPNFEAINQIAMRRLSSPGETAVVIIASDVPGTGVGTYITHQSYLDPATGQPKGSPAAVSTSTTLIGQPYCATGLSILVSSGATTWYYAFWAATGGGAATSTLWLRAVTTSSLATASTTSLGTSADTVATYGIGATCGYVDTGNGNRVVFAQYDNGASLRPDIYQVTRYTYTGSATTTQLVAYNSWIASQPCLYGSTWYFLTGHDDVAVSPVTVGGLQRALYLRDSDGHIHAQVLYGNGPATWHTGDTINWVSLSGGGGTRWQTSQQAVHVPQLWASGTAMYCAVAQASDVDAVVQVATLKIEMAATYGNPVKVAADAIEPGAIPAGWSQRADLREMAPMMFPNYIRRTSGAAADVTGLAAVYRFISNDGTIARSAPVIVTGSFGAGDTVEVPILSHRIHNGLTQNLGAGAANAPTSRVEIEIYAGSTTLQLQGVCSSDDAVPGGTTTYVLPTPIRSGTETLYTTGGAPSNAPLPACLAVAVWNNRLFMATDDGVSYTHEFEQGKAPAHNEILNFKWAAGTGPVLGMMAIDSNYLALFKRDAIGVISGPGPDGRGIGNYTVTTLPTEKGCTNPVTLVTGPAGCYYQGSQTGRFLVVTSGLQIGELGADDYATRTILGAGIDEKHRSIIWLTSGSGVSGGLGEFAEMIALDYQHLTESAPFGHISLWNGNGLGNGAGGSVGTPCDGMGYTARAMCQDSQGPVFITEWGYIRHTNADTVRRDTTIGSGQTRAIPWSVTTGDMVPAGLMGEFDVNEIMFMGSWAISADAFKVTVYTDYATTQTAATTAAIPSGSSPLTLMTKPANCMRIRAIKVKIEDTRGESDFLLDAMAMTFQARGKLQRPATTRVVSSS